jgi:glycosyltransferase involved in cell wall biosynthesis
MTVRVLCISHTAVSHAAGRKRYHPFAKSPDLDVHLVVPDRWEEFGRIITADPPANDGATVHALPVRWQKAGRASWYLHYYPALAALADELKPDIIHLWEEPWSVVALQAVHLRNRRFPKAAIVMEVDQNIFRRLPWPFEMIRKRVLRHTDFVIARSNDAITTVRKSGYTGPAALAGYGVDRSVFYPMDRLQARSRFGITGFTIGYVGRVVTEKGLADAVDAIARTTGLVSLEIMGEGPARHELEAQVRNRGVADRVRFHAWASPGQVAEFINAVDAILLLTRTHQR